MRILMFGWEFPPHISGGLGTACYGLTKALSRTGETEVIFVVPKKWGDETNREVELIGANQVPVAFELANPGYPEIETSFIGVRSDIVPYLSPGQFWKLKTSHYEENMHFVEVSGEGTMKFSGTYDQSLYHEIRNYALVARELAVKQRFDVIHAHDWLAFPAGLAARNASGKPLIVHVHSTEFDRTGGEVNATIYSIEREGMEMADKVITVSNLTRKTVIEKYGIAAGKVVTVYNAVEPLPDRERKLLRKIPGEKIVTFMGRITIQKGPAYFVEAANMLLKRLPYVRFVMAGSGDMMNDIVDHAARLGITHKFHFTGFLDSDSVYQLLDVTDLFVMPSVSEPFGIAPLEAMQAGVPVIISKQSGVAEIVNFVYKTDFWDTCAMADAMYGLLSYRALSSMFSKHGSIEAGNLEWKQTAGIISRIYQEMAGNVVHDPLSTQKNVVNSISQ